MPPVAVADVASATAVADALDADIALATKQLKNLHLEARRELVPPTLEERIVAHTQWSRISGAMDEKSGHSKGFEVYRKIEVALDSFLHPDGTRIRRSPDQRAFHRHMMKACLPKVFAGEWQYASERIIEKLGLKGQKLHSQVVISTPRRYGKTYSVAMFVAACLFCIPGFSVIIYSKAERQSKMMMKTVIRMFRTLTRPFGAGAPGASSGSRSEKYKAQQHYPREITNNAQYFVVLDDRGTEAQLQCLPGISATTRGVGADLIVLEEAGYIPEQLFYETITPLLGVNDTALVGISTPPAEAGNYYLRLFDCKDQEGEDVFDVIKIELQCASCIEKREMHCPHNTAQPPAWKSEKRRLMQAAIYANHPLYYLREVLGIAISDSIYVFTGQLIDAFISPALVAGPSPHEPMHPVFDRPNFIFVGIDPCGGGTMSDTSFCAVTFRSTDRHPVVRSVCRCCFCGGVCSMLRCGGERRTATLVVSCGAACVAGGAAAAAAAKWSLNLLKWSMRRQYMPRTVGMMSLKSGTRVCTSFTPTK
jgi:hypothetical protein